jgi:hypothetical protein
MFHHQLDVFSLALCL